MSYESKFENEYKNYKVDFIELLDELDEGRWTHEPDMRAELDEVYTEATKQTELRKQKGILSGQMDVMEINLNYYKKKTGEYEAKAKAFDHAREILFTEIKFLRNRADLVDDIEEEKELREKLSKFEEVDNNLMTAFFKASFGERTAAEKISERESRQSLKGQLVEKTTNALEKKLEQEIKKGVKWQWN